MEKGFIGNPLICQVALVVKDIEQVAKDYAEFLGTDIPPICVSGTFEEAHTQLRGADCYATCKMAFFDVGENLQIELIQPDELDSVWKDGLDENGEGFHHIAFLIKDTKEKISLLENKGFPLIQQGEYSGGRYSYIDTRSKLKLIVELLEND